MSNDFLSFISHLIALASAFGNSSTEILFYQIFWKFFHLSETISNQEGSSMNTYHHFIGKCLEIGILFNLNISALKLL